MNFEEQRICVTGAAGFIGSNLVDRLLELGAHVIGIDNMYNGKIENLDGALKSEQFEFYKGDIRDMPFLLNLFKDIDIVFHQAAFTNVPQSIIMPETCNDVNVNGVLNILNAVRLTNVEKLIHASSSAIYGDTPTLPKTEDMPRIPISPYGVSKLACEAYMQVYFGVYGVKTVSLRYFNVYGPRQKDSPYSGVIAIWLGCILRDEGLTIFGDGTNSRDFTYIKDVINANLLAAEYGIPGEILNIGAGSPISITNLAKLMLKITGKENLPLRYTDPRPGDIIHSYADISKAKKMIHFQPQYDPEKGLKEYIQWHGKEYNINFNIK